MKLNKKFFYGIILSIILNSNVLTVNALQLPTEYQSSFSDSEYKPVDEKKEIIQADYRGKTIKVDCKDTSGQNYRKIQSALDSISIAPTNESERITISIEPGIYVEKLVIYMPYISFINADETKEVKITYDAGSGKSVPTDVKDRSDGKSKWDTENCASVMIGKGKNWVDADATGFYAKGITFENHYNTVTSDTKTQAIAFSSMSDKVILEDCSFIGRQDTLYLKGDLNKDDSARVYLKNCYIEGHVDFIFGNATAVFDSCQIHMIYRSSGGYYTAPNTNIFDTGFAFINSTFTTEGNYGTTPHKKVYLGRGWQTDARFPDKASNTALINCTMSNAVNTTGPWLVMEKGGTSNRNKYRFYEYNLKYSDNSNYSNSGDYKETLTDEQAKGYTATNILRSRRNVLDNWNPTNQLFDIKEKVYPTGVVISDSSTENNYCNVSVYENSSANTEKKLAKLQALVIPMTSEQDIIWSSDNESIATISQDGVVYGVKTGSCNVYATSKSSGYKAEVNVTVITGTPPTIETESTTQTTTETTTETTTSSTIQGDVNNDKALTASDASLLLSYVLNNDSISFTNEQKNKSDVNKDNQITSVDAATILSKVLNNDFKFQ